MTEHPQELPLSELLADLKAQYGMVGMRDVDVATWNAKLDRAIYALTSRRESPTAQGWISVDEALPQVEDRVLAYCIGWPKKTDQPFLAHRVTLNLWSDTRRSQFMPAVTHWMPLPATPTESKT